MSVCLPCRHDLCQDRELCACTLSHEPEPLGPPAATIGCALCGMYRGHGAGCPRGGAA